MRHNLKNINKLLKQAGIKKESIKSFGYCTITFDQLEDALKRGGQKALAELYNAKAEQMKISLEFETAKFVPCPSSEKGELCDYCIDSELKECKSHSQLNAYIETTVKERKKKNEKERQFALAMYSMHKRI